MKKIVTHFLHCSIKILLNLKIYKSKSEDKSQPMPDWIKLYIRLKMIMLSLSQSSNKEMTKRKELKINLNNSKTPSLKWNLLTTVLTSKQLKTNSKLKRTFHLSTIKLQKGSNFHRDWTKLRPTLEFSKINLTSSFQNKKNWEGNIIWILTKIKI